MKFFMKVIPIKFVRNDLDGHVLKRLGNLSLENSAHYLAIGRTMAAFLSKISTVQYASNNTIVMVLAATLAVFVVSGLLAGCGVDPCDEAKYSKDQVAAACQTDSESDTEEVSSGEQGAVVTQQTTEASQVTPMADPATYQICQKSTSARELSSFINESYLVVADYSEEAQGSSELVAGLVVSMIMNGLDFTKLQSYKITFDSGIYVLGAVGSGRHVAFRLSFAEDFGSYQEGDPIPYNVFDFKSYVMNLETKSPGELAKISTKSSPESLLNSINQLQGENTSLTYSFDKGPLFEMLQTNLPTSGNLDSFHADVLRLRSHLISLEVQSVGKNKVLFPVGDTGELTITMTTPPTPVDSISDSIAVGDFGFSYDGSVFERQSSKTKQTFYESIFYIKSDEVGSYWQGTFKSELLRGSEVLYISGDVSNRKSQPIYYYCDAANLDQAAVLTKDRPQDNSDRHWTLKLRDGDEVAFVVQ